MTGTTAGEVRGCAVLRRFITIYVRVNAVAPGTIRSTGTDRYPPELVVKAEQQTPAGRLGSPAEVSHLVTFLASVLCLIAALVNFLRDIWVSLHALRLEVERALPPS